MVDCTLSTSGTSQAPFHALASSLLSESKISRRGNVAQRTRLFTSNRVTPSPIHYSSVFRSNRVCREDQYNGNCSFEDTKRVASPHPQHFSQHSARLHGTRPHGHHDTFEEVWMQSSALAEAEASIPPLVRCLGSTINHSERFDQNLDNAFSRSLAVSDPIIAEIFHRYRPTNWDPAKGDEDRMRYTEGTPGNATPTLHQYGILGSSDRAQSPKLGFDVADYMRYHESQELSLPVVLAARPDMLSTLASTASSSSKRSLATATITPLSTSQTDHEQGGRKPIFWANRPCMSEDEERRDLSVMEWQNQQERNETFLGEWRLANSGIGDDSESSDIAEKRLRVVLGHLPSKN